MFYQKGGFRSKIVIYVVIKFLLKNALISVYHFATDLEVFEIFWGFGDMVKNIFKKQILFENFKKIGKIE